MHLVWLYIFSASSHASYENMHLLSIYILYVLLLPEINVTFGGGVGAIFIQLKFNLYSLPYIPHENHSLNRQILIYTQPLTNAFCCNSQYSKSVVLVSNSHLKF